MFPSKRHDDRLLHALLLSAASLSGGIVLLIFGYLLLETLPIWKDVPLSQFFRDVSWNPLEGQYNIVPLLVGSLSVMVLAVSLAAPLGFLTVVFLHFYAKDVFAQVLRRMIEVLGGIPSVVYGFWGLLVLVPLINRWHPPGASLLAGALILSIMILPSFTLIVDASFASVPKPLLHGAIACGLDPWGLIKAVLLPSCWPAILTGLLLQMGRAIGETMAVLMVCGNVVQLPSSLFDPIRTLASHIVLEMAYAMGHHRSALFVCGLFLIFIVALLILITRRLAAPYANE